MKQLFFVLWFLLSASTVASATTLYVYPNCSGKPTPCYTTPQAAANIVNPGDTVIVGNGTYTGGSTYVLSINRAGTSSNWITFRAENQWGAVLDGNNFASGYGIQFGDNAAYLVVDGLDIKNTGKDGLRFFDGSHDITVKNSLIHGMNHRVDCVLDCGDDVCGKSGVYTARVGSQGAANYVLDSNVFYDIGRTSAGVCDLYAFNHDHGLYTNADYVWIVNNIFYNNLAGYDITIANSAGHYYIYNNTFASPVNPGRDGVIYTDISNAYILVENNIFYLSESNGEFAVRNVGTDTNSTFKNNLLYNPSGSIGTHTTSGNNTGTPGGTGGWTISGNLTSNPLFDDASGHDYRLQSGSPAIGLANTSTATATDYIGIPRDGDPDSGAYEYAAGGGDTEDPTVPTNVVAADTGTTTMSVTWSASTDNVGVTGYKVYRDSVLIYSNVTGTSFSDSGLTADTQYSYQVSAHDAAGNESALSAQGSDYTDPIGGGSTNYNVIFGKSTVKNTCDNFSAANSLSVGDFQTWKMMYDFSYLYVCVASTDTNVVADCARDGNCYADDCIETRFSPTYNITSAMISTDIALTIAANNQKYDYSGAGEKDIPLYSQVTISPSGYVIWARIPLSSITSIIPKAGTVWGFLASETQGSQQTYVQKAWPLGISNYANPSLWGQVTFGAPSRGYLTTK